MSKWGGKRAGAGRPQKFEVSELSYKIWAYVHQRTEETGAEKAAKEDAAREFGMSVTRIKFHLGCIDKAMTLLLFLQITNPEKAAEAVRSAEANGWFAGGWMREFMESLTPQS